MKKLIIAVAALVAVAGAAAVATQTMAGPPGGVCMGPYCP
ncbi:hypothetical protein ABAC460_13400 [Asticcacaulis sp. AC460]|nr:hypothetical protein ABAC460_13400 [Asticcacaulis sp. AC460]